MHAPFAPAPVGGTSDRPDTPARTRQYESQGLPLPETVDLIKDDGGDYHLAGDADATLRVGKAAWTKYVNALASMKSAALQIEKTATRPVYCTPEQEEALRSVAKPGAWIVVREQGSPPSTVPLVADGSTVDENGRPEDSGSSLSLVVPAVAPPPPGPPRRPRPGRCPYRGGLPHKIGRAHV